MRGSWAIAGAVVLLCLCAVKMYQVIDSGLPCVLREMEEKRDEWKKVQKGRREEGRKAGGRMEEGQEKRGKK